VALVPFPSQSSRDEEPDDLPAQAGGFSPFGEPDPAEPPEGRMTFLEHLDELRKRITHAVSALFIGFVIALAFINRVVAFVYQRLTKDIPGGHLIYTEPGEAFILLLKIAALTGVLIASPYIMWQVWLFIAPGLYAKEKKLAIPFVVASSSLFVGGAAFAHYVVFPAAWRFFAGFSNDFITFTPRIEPVFALYVKLMLGMGLVFQMPVLMFVLARLGIVTAGFLAKNIKYAVLLIFIAAAVITPDSSPVSQVLVAGPMCGLYLIGIAVAWAFGKSKKIDPDDEKL
jgi:sec-independent protein translocase protein TatC